MNKIQKNVLIYIPTFIIGIVVGVIINSIKAQTTLESDSENPPEVTLTWDFNEESRVIGYNIYRGSQSKSYELFESVGPDSNQLTFDFDGRYRFFAVTAYDENGLESPFSDELVIQTITIQSSEDLENWRDRYHFLVDKDQEFFRIGYN